MIFEKIYETENLQEAWKRVRANRAKPGVDHVRSEDFEKNLDINLSAIKKQIKNGTYQPLPVMVYTDRKDKGKGRTIGISTVRDRVVQQAIAKILSPVFEGHFMPCSYAYRPKKSALAAANQASQSIKEGNLWLLKMDVTSFFDSIVHSILLKMIQNLIDEEPLLDLISKLLKAKIFKEMGLFDSTIGSQQGSGLSPLLSNIYLHPLDKLMWNIHKTKYSRYSDDIAVFDRDSKPLEQSRELIEQALSELKLASNAEKTSISHISSGVVYLGFVMNEKGKGPCSKSVEQLQDKLSAYNKIKKTEDIEKKLQEINIQIRGWFNYYQTLKMVTPPNILTLLSLVHLSKELGQLDYARELIQQHEIFHHHHPQIHFQFGELFYSLGMTNHALREFALALQNDPLMSSARERIQKIQTGEKNLHKAIDTTRMVIHHHPQYSKGYQELSEYYAKLGLYGFAEKSYKKAFELDDKVTPSVSFQPDSKEHTDSSDDLYQNSDLGDQEIFLRIFKGRTDAHGVQWIDELGRWGFARRDRALSMDDVRNHLKGEETLAVYLVTANDSVSFIVFDVDISKRKILECHETDLEKLRKQTHNDLLRIKTVCRSLGLELYISDSGYKGRHGWLFFAEEIPADRAIYIGTEIIKRAGSPSGDMIWELFPRGKTDRDQNLIKLPLGINRKNNRRCLFLNDDGTPVKNPFQFLKSMRKNDISGLKFSDSAEKKNDDSNVIETPPAIRNMVNRCNILKYLITKAKETNYLNHHERICLLYTLSFAGEQGCEFLHKVIAYCMNYDRYYTQRQIERRKASPISCGKIRENFSEVIQTIPCDCKFTLPPKSYPSPVLHLLEAEIEKNVPSPPKVNDRNDMMDIDERKAKNHDIAITVESLFSRENSGSELNGDEQNFKEAVLDFKNIFSLDGTDNLNQSHEKPDQKRIESPPVIEVKQKIDTPEDDLPPWDETTSEPVSGNKTNLNKEDTYVWELFLKYLRLRNELKKNTEDLNSVSDKLEKRFSELQTDIIKTEMGNIQREGIGNWKLMM